jgi:hypothetical protein
VTLIELILVIGILAVIAGLVIPNFVRELEREKLPGSARQLRSLLTLVRANACFDGKRYRIRFPLEEEEELDALGGDRQPLIEREDDPINEPEIFNLVTAPWAVGETLLGEVWCAEVRLERPTVELLREIEERDEIADELEEAFEDFEPERLPLYIEPDGTSEWVTFVLTDAPRDTELEDLYKLEEIDAEYSVIELIVEGVTGMAWLQRPLYEEELDLFEERGWPVVLRQDFLDPRVLTEEDVLELHDVPIE